MEYVDVFFDASAKDDLHFYALYVDTHTFNHHKYNGGEAEIGFNKLIYQLLLHKQEVRGRTTRSRCFWMSAPPNPIPTRCARC